MFDMAKEEKEESKTEVQKVEPTHVLSPFEEMERMFEGHFPRNWMHPFGFNFPAFPEIKAFEGKTPSVDVIEHDNEVIVKAELPGVDKKDLEISVTNKTVTIKGSTSHEEKEEKGDYYRCEISRGSYSRTLSLPAEVDEEKTKAKFKNGILKLTLPKLKKSKRHNVKVE